MIQVYEKKDNSIQGVQGEGGEILLAECIDLPIVTQGKTLDEVVENIREAIELHLEGEDLEELGISPHFSVLINMELEYAKA